MDFEYKKRLARCIPRNILLGLEGEGVVQEILTKGLPQGYTVERIAPNLLQRGKTDFIIRDPQGKVVLYIEVKNWAQYPVSHKTVASQVLKRVPSNSVPKLLITSSRELANRPELERNGWSVAHTLTQRLPWLTGKQYLDCYLKWKRTVAIELTKLGLYCDLFRKHNAPNAIKNSLDSYSKDVCKTSRSTEVFKPENQRTSLFISRISRLRFSLVDFLLIYTPPLEIYALGL